MNDKPLVSVLVLAYRNADLIGEALDSIFEQDYENIELIVSDDCSGDFDRHKIMKYVQPRNRGNITRFEVNENEINLGSVRHANKAYGLSHGRFLKFLAADDALYDHGVIGDFVDFFQKTGALVVTSQCLIYDETLTRVLAPALSEDHIHKIRTLSPPDLFLALIQNLVIAAPAVGFSRAFFDIYGLFDENYRIDEDRPMWLRISRLGCPIHYMDRVTAKYRSGGISTQNARCDERPLIRYVEDLIKVWDLEILPYREILGDSRWRKLVFDYLRQYEWPPTFSDPSPVRFF